MGDRILNFPSSELANERSQQITSVAAEQVEERKLRSGSSFKLGILSLPLRQVIKGDYKEFSGMK